MAAIMAHLRDSLPDDVILTNGPYSGGQHLPDFVAFKPVFAEGRRVAIAAAIVHHVDVGEAEIELAKGRSVGEVCKQIGVTDQTYYRWRRQYGGMSRDQLKRLKELEKENSRLRRAVSDLTLDKMILKEAAKGNF